MDDRKTFSELSGSDKLALLGNVLICIGGMAVSVSQLLRLSASGRIGEQIVNPGQVHPGNANNSAPSTRARDYFTI